MLGIDSLGEKAAEVVERYLTGDREGLAFDYARDMVKTHLLNSKVKGLKEEEEAWHELDEYFDYLEKKEMKEIKNIPKPPKYEDEED